ncbi:MAG: hypothetical protein ACE5GW_06655 [Planctomycetota bacterium]
MSHHRSRRRSTAGGAVSARAPARLLLRGAVRTLAAWGTLLVALSGCGGGDDDGTGRVIAPVSASSVSVIPDPAGTVVQFVLVSPHGHPMTVEVAYSEDRGLSYSPAALLSGNTAALDATPEGSLFQVTWSPQTDLENLDQSDLRIRVTPTDDTTGSPGVGAASAVFGLGDNAPPAIVSITTPAVTVGGEVSFDYTVRDANGDHVGLLLEFSLDGGGSWSVATPGSGGEGTESITADAVGIPHSVTWWAQNDAPGFTGTVGRLRLTPVDIESGSAGTTLTFSVNLIAPSVALITIGEIPETMNGSLPYTGAGGQQVSFSLHVPPSLFTLGVEHESAPGGAAVDPASLDITAGTTLGGAIPAGVNLAPYFSGGPGGGTWPVPAEIPFPTGTVTLSARVSDLLGNISDSATLTLEVITGSAAAAPFDHLDRWWLDFESDYFAISASYGGTVTVSSTAGANGIPDHLEDLEIVGLQSDSPTAGCVLIGSNDILRTWAEEEVLGRLRVLFGGEFDVEGGGFSPNLLFARSSAGTTSSIRIGGDDSVPGFTLGRAHFDYRNAVFNHDRSPSLGVFTTNLIDYYINISYSFQSRFQALRPDTGVPGGEHDLDSVVLDPSFERLDTQNSAAENQRYDEIWFAIDAWGRAVAAITAHEIGHSIGLCANGTPPLGLFGGVDEAPFAGPYTNDYHFDSPGNNIMASALSFNSALVSGPSGYRFNELNGAYLREWILLGY